MIQLSSISLRRGTKVLLQQSSLSIFAGQRVALIGQNGCGKSSLFALLRGEIEADEGDTETPSYWRFVSVAQETPATDRSALEYVIDGDKALRQLERQLAVAESANEGEKIAQLHVQLGDAGAFDVHSRASSILSGLGFSQSELTRPVDSFSGGWRMRLNLAQALLCPSDCLLLDEPTNHLDLDAVIWLEKWLQQYAGTLLLISHDKAFIDATANQIVSIEHKTLVTYTGNYSSYETQRAERLRQQDIAYTKQQQNIEHLNSFITRFKAKASKAKQAQSRIKQLEKMQQLLPAHKESPFDFTFAKAQSLPNPLVNIQDSVAGYGDKTVLEKIKLNLVPGSRIGLLGRNGQGKSTLIKLLAGTLAPLSGTISRSKGCDVGYFAQHQLETLDPDASALLHLQRLDSKATEQQLRSFLGGFNFHGDEALGPVAPMSGGEKARLVLALLVYQKPNLLLLDEPTNHLDLEMRHALSIALQEFDGAMVLVSHDRVLLESVCEEFYLVHSKRVEPFSGDMNDYKKWVLTQQVVETDQPEQVGSTAPQIDRKAQKRREAERREALRPLKKVLEKAEKQLNTLSNDLEQIETQMADPSLYDEENKEKLNTLLQQQALVSKQLSQVEEQWMDAQDAFEQAQNDE